MPSPRTFLQNAIEHHASGRLEDAERLYRELLQADPLHTDANHRLGTLLVGLGQPHAALPHLKSAVDTRPAQAAYWVDYADGLLAAGRADDAMAALGEARAHGARGSRINALRERIATAQRPGPNAKEVELLGAHFAAGRLSEAEALARHMTLNWPKHGFGWMALGTLLGSQRRFVEALPVLQTAAALLPSDAAAQINLANVLVESRQLPEAEACCRRALELQPALPDAYGVLGNVLRDLGRAAEAEAAYRRALEIDPAYHATHNNLGNVLRKLGRFAEAEASFRNAIHVEPRFVEAHGNLANTLIDLGRLSEAETALRLAIDLDPGHPDAHNNLGNVLRELGRLHEARASFREALARDAGFREARVNLGNALLDLGESQAAEAEYRRALGLDPQYGDAHANLLFLLNYDADRSAEEIFEAYRQYDAKFAAPLRKQWHPHANARDPGRRLRVGYVSPDFRNHACRFFIEPMLGHHDRQAFEVFAYADVVAEDAVSARMKAQVAHWVPTAGLDDAQLAERIRADGIDILVDLAGHTRGNRLLAFARKPAPVSVTTLGFGCTTGLSAIDWYLTDSLVVPEGFEHVCSEKPWRIGQCLVYRPAEGMGEAGSLPALEAGHVTFGTLTRMVRINHRTVNAWAQILRQVPGSHLRIDNGNFRDARLCDSLRARFAAQGIAPERLELGFHSPPWDVLRAIDIGLDCFPHNSGTTLFESLYMGIPFVTLASRPSVGRLGASILTHLGHPEWIANSEAEYVDKSVALAADLAGLAGLRLRLRDEMRASPLMDEPAHVRDVEAAYQGMWQLWCSKTPEVQSPY